MQKAEELYSKTISRLAPNERLRLASLILDGLAQRDQDRRSALDLLDALPGGRVLKTSAEADAYLREERDSWGR